MSEAAVAADGTVYVGAGFSLYALDSTGNTKWEFETGVPKTWRAMGGGLPEYIRPRCSPTLSRSGIVYYATGEGKLYALTPDGHVKWTHKAADAITCSPAIARDGTVYFTCRGGRLYSVNPSGTLRWIARSPDSASWYESPMVADDGAVYVRDSGIAESWTPPGVSSFAANGHRRWRFKTGRSENWENWDLALSLGPDGTVYVAGKGLYALRPDGALKWRRPYSSSQAPAVSRDGTVYVSMVRYGRFDPNEDVLGGPVPDSFPRLAAVSPSGKELWSISMPRIGAVSLVDDRLLCVAGCAVGEAGSKE